MAMTKADLAQALVDKMVENGRYGAEVSDADRRNYVWWVKKLHVAEIRRRLDLEQRGIDSRRSTVGTL